jgi:hypothetical protein
MKREARKKGRVDEKGNLILRPEDRMKENAWFAAFMFPAALIWYGWSVDKGVMWIVPVRSSPGFQFSIPLLTQNIDDSEFLLRRWLNDNLCHGHNYAYRVYAS